MSKPTNSLVSNCHKAPMRVVGGTEGTNHYECVMCLEACDPVSAKNAPTGELNTQREDELMLEIERAANYLYSIEGELDLETRQRIDMTRQLINECFVHKGKSLSNQYLYDRLKPIFAKQREQAQQELVKILDETQKLLNQATTEEHIVYDIQEYVKAKRLNLTENGDDA